MSPSDKDQPKSGYIVSAQALAFQQGTASLSRLSLTGEVRNCGFLSAPSKCTLSVLRFFVHFLSMNLQDEKTCEIAANFFVKSQHSFRDFRGSTNFLPL